MVSINYASREISCKIVYYGPGLSGKTTNLQYVHQKVPAETKGKLISLATDADRTLYFDFLPINIGAINGFAAKFQLYTVPGQVYYNATRKLVLRGVDGLVFVADSQRDKMDENIESFNNLRENLAEYGYKLDEIPIVIQYNKQDLPGVMTPDEIRPLINKHGWREFKASATEGFGVFDTLKCILKIVLDRAKTGGTVPSSRPVGTVTPQTPATPSTPVPMAAEAAGVVPRLQPQPQLHQERMAAPQESFSSRESTEATPAFGLPIAARQTDATPVSGLPTTDVRPTPAYANELMTREPVQEANTSTPSPESKYRPFPGNTAEEELRMRLRQQDARARSGGIMTNTPQQPLTISSPAGMPKMEPSLKKAEAPHKKRSFFKRLFGFK